MPSNEPLAAMTVGHKGGSSRLDHAIAEGPYSVVRRGDEGHGRTLAVSETVTRIEEGPDPSRWSSIGDENEGP